MYTITEYKFAAIDEGGRLVLNSEFARDVKFVCSYADRFAALAKMVVPELSNRDVWEISLGVFVKTLDKQN